MDMMRKLMRHGGAVGVDAAHSQDHTLGLMHLRKLFSELKQPPAGATQADLENTLYNMLPLFCKVCKKRFIHLFNITCGWHAAATPVMFYVSL